MNPSALAAALLRARTLVDDSMSVAKLQVLMMVAASGDAGIDQQTLTHRSQQSRSGCSKNCHDLGTVTVRKAAGPGLVVTEADPMNLRTNIVRLTPRGRMIVDQILKGAS